MHGFRRYVALLLVLAGLALTGAGCSGSGGSDTGDGSSSGGTTTYTNDQYGFTLTHDKQFSEGAGRRRRGRRQLRVRRRLRR